MKTINLHKIHKNFILVFKQALPTIIIVCVVWYILSILSYEGWTLQNWTSKLPTQMISWFYTSLHHYIVMKTYRTSHTFHRNGLQCITKLVFGHGVLFLWNNSKAERQKMDLNMKIPRKTWSEFRIFPLLDWLPPKADYPNFSLLFNP